MNVVIDLFGPHVFISESSKQLLTSSSVLVSNIEFCNHCESMTKNFKLLNEKCRQLEEKCSQMEELTKLQEEKLSFLKKKITLKIKDEGLLAPLA